MFPLRSPLISSKLCPFFILATWIVAMAVSSPRLFANKLIEYPRRRFCRMLWNEAFGEPSSVVNYFTATFDVFFYIPVALLTILYSIILIKLKSQKIPGGQSSNANEQRAKRNRKVLKMDIAIVLGFVFCGVPFSIVKLVKFFVWDNKLPCSMSLYWSIALFMARGNSAINPCICFIFSGNYRGALKRLLNCFSGAARVQNQ